MTIEIPEAYRDLFQKKSFGHLATVMEDGCPQSTPVWVDYDGKHVVVNTTLDRQKYENLERDPRVSISIQDPDDPYRYLEVRGRVAETTEDGAEQHIDALARRYLGKDRYPWRKEGEERVLVKIAPEHFTSMG
ncbi:MAG TPA: PPOX class F420-dependent oxidoreductase [Alphaproteobacteria bacterium]|nr:PPOX class F420-dependent oxidoreductase [Alphaproteobacteria bacterium]